MVFIILCTVPTVFPSPFFIHWESFQTPVLMLLSVWTCLHYLHERAPAVFSEKMVAIAFHCEAVFLCFKYFSGKNIYKSSSYTVRKNTGHS